MSPTRYIWWLCTLALACSDAAGPHDDAALPSDAEATAADASTPSADATAGGGDTGTDAAVPDARAPNPSGCGLLPLPPGAPGGLGPEGFGAATLGGGFEDGLPIVCVTTLADSGPGSLREALSGGDRRIHFAVGGTIMLGSRISARGLSHVTIDGSTAPAPGITLYGRELELRNCDDVVVRHVRSRSTGDVDANQPGITIWCPDRPCSGFWLDHVSVSRASDDSILVYEQVRDVTVSFALVHDAYSSIDPSPEAMLISGSNPHYADRVTVHHSVLSGNFERNPSISGDPDPGDAPTTVDFRNNVVHGWGNGGYGTRFRYNATGNAVNNLYLSTGGGSALALDDPMRPVFTSGNDPATLDAVGTAAGPIPAPPTTLHSTVSLRAPPGANPVLDHAGAFPRDAVDAAAIAAVSASAR